MSEASVEEKQLEEEMLNVVARIDAKLNLLTEAETAPRKRTLSEASRELPSKETSSSLSPDMIVSTCDF